MNLTDYRYALHFGVIYEGDGKTPVIKADTMIMGTLGRATVYLVADGDSFLTWGEIEVDNTAHLIVGLHSMPFSLDVAEIGDWVSRWVEGEIDASQVRLCDYAVLTDTDRWGYLNGEEGETRTIPTLRPVV